MNTSCMPDTAKGIEGATNWTKPAGTALRRLMFYVGDPGAAGRVSVCTGSVSVARGCE